MSAATSELRRYALGGTDVSAICGVSPFRSEHDVFLEKTGRLRGMPRNYNPRAEWGTKLQRVVADAYSEITGRPHEWMDTTQQHPLFEHGVWTPDALLTRDPGGLDAKTTSLDQLWNWGDPVDEPDGVPDYVALQCHWYLSAARDREFWDVALYFGSTTLRIYRVMRDHELEAMLLDKAREWWAKHVTEDVAPEITATSTTAQYLKFRHRCVARTARSRGRFDRQVFASPPRMEAHGSGVQRRGSEADGRDRR